jgi:hypothetical protein
MIGARYWSTGITIREDDRGTFSASLEFLDNGFCQDDSSEGTLRLRYWVPDALLAVRTLKQDAERLGIDWDGPVGATVYAEHDGEFEDGDRPGLRALANALAAEVGWTPCYSEEVIPGSAGAL